MAADVSTKSHATASDRPTDLEIPDPLPAIEGAVSPERDDKYQGPHAWRKSLRPVQSPIKFDCLLDGPDDKQSKPRQLPPWKRDLIEHNKKVARLVRRESSGRSKRTAIVRRESSGRAKRPPGSESPSGLGRKKSFRNENPFTQQVVNEAGQRRRVSPANSFKREGCIRRTPSDKAFDPNDPATKKRLERVRRSRLYLLQQMGPNSFQIVGDSPDHKFKVIIGPQTCTCGKVPHCVHVLFVMLRVFQIKETDSCLWSKQLKNYEVENLFRVYNDKRTLRIEAKARRRNQRPSPDASQSPSPETSVVPSESDAGSIREEDETCPICLLDMLEGESLQKCGECQNKLHHHCITVWFEECKRQSDPLICPLCRARWKNTSNEIKQEDPTPTVVESVPHVPSSPRAPSPHDLDRSRLPYAEPIPGDYINVAAPWIEILGEDLVSCLFSRNWSIRETGLKHLAKEMSREMVKVTGESRSGAGGMTMSNTATMLKLLECSFGVVAYMCNDPVYKVFVGCLVLVRPFVEIMFQHQCIRTSVADGPNPSFNEELEIPFKAPNDDYSPSNLQTLTDSIFLNLFDEVVVDIQQDDREKGSTVHQRIEKKWLGSLKIPFTTIYFNGKIDGTFRVDAPPVLLGYMQDKGFSEDIAGIDQNIKTLLSLFITIEPPLTQPEPVKERFSTNEDERLMVFADQWMTDMMAKFTPKRVVKTYVTDINFKSVFITRYFRPIKPPDEITGRSSLEANSELVARYVALIPFISDSVIFPGLCDIWNTCDQFLQMLSGDEEEHAIMLVNFFLHLGKKAWLICGTAIPEGPTAYVLSQEDAGFWIWNPSSGEHFRAQDMTCPLQSIGCLVNHENIWANIQQYDKPAQMSFKLTDTACWETIFGRGYPDPQLGSLQPESLYFFPTDKDYVTELQEKIQQVLKNKIMDWRSRYITRWNRHCTQIMRKLLPVLEENCGKSVDEQHILELEQSFSSYKVSGFPINMPFTEMDPIVEAVFATGVHAQESSDVEYALAVYVHPYPNSVLSVWVYVASLNRIR